MSPTGQLTPTGLDIRQYLERKREEVDQYLQSVIPSAETMPTTLHESMRYSLFAGGKRVRPILAIAAAEAVGHAGKAVLPVASSLELIHTYSLIHDDLPAMDNDDFRRGKPTNHKVYGEAMAILAGDALLTMAFELCARANAEHSLDAARQVQLIRELAVGSGNLTAGATPAQLDDLTFYAEQIGLAFQIADDVLNVTGTREELGKNPNTDAQRGKKTYPTFYGVEGAKQLAEECVTRANDRLASFGSKADPLRELARYITSRKN